MTNGAAAKLKMGVYHFAYAGYTENNTGLAEAQYFLSIAGGYIREGYLRPMLDVEDAVSPAANSPGVNLGKSGLSKWIAEFADEVRRNTGVDIILYSTPDYVTNYFATNLNKYPLWVATYPAYPDDDPGNVGPWPVWTLERYRTRPGTQNTDPNNTTQPYTPGLCLGVGGYVDLDSLNELMSLDALLINPLAAISIAGPNGGSLQPPKNGEFQLWISATGYQAVTVQASDNMTTWTNITIVPTSGGTAVFSDTNVQAQSARFYRVKP